MPYSVDLKGIHVGNVIALYEGKCRLQCIFNFYEHTNPYPLSKTGSFLPFALS